MTEPPVGEHSSLGTTPKGNVSVAYALVKPRLGGGLPLRLTMRGAVGELRLPLSTWLRIAKFA
jgi:hypothetical protein